MATLKVLSRNARVLFSRSHSFFVRQDLWTADNVVKSPFRDVKIPDTTMIEHVWKNMDRWPDKTALICGISNRSYTYSDLYKSSRAFAANLRKKIKITDGDVVCIMMHNSPEYAVATLGILEAGAELTTVNPIYTAHELQKQLTLSNPKVIIGSNETVKVIKDAFRLAKKEIPIIIVKTPEENLPSDTINFLDLSKDHHADLDVLKKVNRKADDVSILPYSSGTTGFPKGVELTNRNVVVNCIQQNVDGVRLHDDTTGSQQDSIMAVLPFYHIYGLSIIMLHKLSVGSKIVTLPKFQPNTFLTALKDQKVSLVFAAPPMVLFLGSQPVCTKDHLQYAKNITCGAAPVPKRDILNVLEKMPPSADFTQIYGLTETSPLATKQIPGSTNYTSAGFGISNTELKVIDSEGKHLGPNEVGELLIKGPQVMKGYRNNLESTKATITEDGWLRTGDLAFLDKDGSVTIADRLKELIKVKSFQVPPAELESILKEHPAVLDAGVVGIPDERSGEVPKAFVVLKEGQKEDPEGIKEFVKERVAEFKRIREIEFLDSLPKNPSGKLLRRILKEKYC